MRDALVFQTWFLLQKNHGLAKLAYISTVILELQIHVVTQKLSQNIWSGLTPFACKTKLCAIENAMSPQKDE